MFLVFTTEYFDFLQDYLFDIFIGLCRYLLTFNGDNKKIWFCADIHFEVCIRPKVCKLFHLSESLEYHDERHNTTCINLGDKTCSPSRIKNLQGSYV